MDWLELGETFKCKVSDVWLFDTDELGEEADCLDARLPWDVMLINDCKVDSFEEDGVVTVVLIDMLRHFDLLIDTFDLSINLGKKLRIIYRWRHHLQDLKNFDLEPRARCHVVIVILRVLLHVGQDCYKLRHMADERFVAEHLNRRSQEVAS